LQGTFLAAIPYGWLAVSMTENEPPPASELPSDRRLREDVAPAAEEESIADPEKRFTPSQTNAGQQVAGLASATDYREEEDPESQGDSNNPI
jgi:hypothetical protein